MGNLFDPRHRYTRRELLKSAAGAGVGAAALGVLGGRGPRRVSAQVNRPEKVKVLVEDVVESSRSDFSRGRMRGVGVSGAGSGAVLRSQTGGEFESGVIELPISGTHVGLHWRARGASPGNLGVSVRASGNGRSWSGWQNVNIEAIADLSAPGDAIPIHGHLEGNSNNGMPGEVEIFASLIGVGRARFVQYRVMFPSGDETELEAMTVTALNSEDGPREFTTAAVPTHLTLENDAGIQIGLNTREGWGADESLRFDAGGNKIWREMYVPVKKVFLHHTATSNNYSDGAAEVRAIYTYHAQTLGWGDIGYNILVDRFGNIYEGRHGRGEADLGEREPLSDDVVAGHVFAYNYGTTGIAAIGNSQHGTWNRSWGNAGLQAVEDAVAFECGRGYLDPEGASSFLRSDRVWHQGELLHCVGHQDADGDGGATACPGSRLYSYLNDTLRQNVANRLNGGSAPSNLSGEQSGDTLQFTWNGDGDGYWYLFEGWWKEEGATPVDYLTEHADDSGYPDIDSEPIEWTWHELDGVQASFSVSDIGHYTMHVRSASNGFVYASHTTILVEEIDEVEDPETGTISGTVTDSNGQSLEGALVEIDGTSVTTDSDGFYTLADVPAGDHTVVASADGYSPASEDVTVTGDDFVEVNFTLEGIPTGSISGTVSSIEGDPIAGATVSVAETGQSATTDTDGAYLFADVPEGEYTIEVSADGYQPATRAVTVVDGGTVTAEFVLEAEEEEIPETMHVLALAGSSSRQGSSWVATVTITVTDDLGNPVQGATVVGEWSGSFSGEVSNTTGSDGTCSVSTGSIPNRDQSATFTVTDVSNGLEYSPEDNAQSSITVTR